MSLATKTRTKDTGRPARPGHSGGEFAAATHDGDALAASDLAGREAEFAAKAAGYERGTTGSYPEFWRRQAAIDELIDAPAPAGLTDAQLRGWRSVNRDNFNFDPSQPFQHTAWHLHVNEELARDQHAPYRIASDPEAQAEVDQMWDARADRIAELRELYEKCAEFPLDVRLG